MIILYKQDETNLKHVYEDHWNNDHWKSDMSYTYKEHGDISQNPSINLVQHTTEVNEMKKILEEYIAQYSFRNLTQPNIEVEKQEEIKKEDTTQNPINLTEHTNELNVLKDIQQHDITQYNNSINLMQPTNEVDKQDRIKKEDFICEVKDNSNLQID
ncbi:uncharacterized protein LOC126894412 isoform X3 [Daktulosphaira vitifoliae]|uniref:uncharacterized protein LOC126894412 isoform X3 n=1 Tax=Daktulosphaira vitifoliae TaxID=58002 RepID=UPI0021A9C7FB|nr:uncharacterized protein LOC126894412 isoform X3 [Daktulosphaira vitifoliae]